MLHPIPHGFSFQPILVPWRSAAKVQLLYPRSVELLLFPEMIPKYSKWKSLGKSEDVFLTSSFCITFLYHEKIPKIYTSSLHLTQLRKPSDEQNCLWVVTFPWFAIFCWEGEIQPPTLTLTTHLPGGRSRDICRLKKQR